MSKDAPESKLFSGTFILAQLQRFGSNMNRKHEVSFWLYFPNELSAQQAARRGKSAGLQAEVSPPLKDFKAGFVRNPKGRTKLPAEPRNDERLTRDGSPYPKHTRKNVYLFQKGSNGSQWLCLFYCPHVPDESLLDGISSFCMDLASEFGGKYDGWEARLEKKTIQDGTV